MAYQICDCLWLEEETVFALGRFSALWNWFETTLWEKTMRQPNADRTKINMRLAQQCAQSEALSFNTGKMNDFRIAWDNRMEEYRREHLGEDIDNAKALFPDGAQRGKWTENDIKLAVKFISNNEDNSANILTMGCVVMLYRIRDNMFHGLKELSSLDNQRALFEAANECILTMCFQEEKLPLTLFR